MKPSEYFKGKASQIREARVALGIPLPCPQGSRDRHQVKGTPQMEAKEHLSEKGAP